jgi:hypothetical protein
MDNQRGIHEAGSHPHHFGQDIPVAIKNIISNLSRIEFDADLAVGFLHQLGLQKALNINQAGAEQRKQKKNQATNKEKSGFLGRDKLQAAIVA